MTDLTAYEEISRLIEQRVEAIRGKKVDAIVSTYAPDVVAFDVVNTPSSTGSTSIEDRLNVWFSSFEGPIDFEIRNLMVDASADVAFCYGLSHVIGSTTGDGQIDMFYRTTICYRKMNSRWVITHEHDSVPFNVENGRASLDLKL